MLGPVSPRILFGTKLEVKNIFQYVLLLMVQKSETSTWDV